MRPLLLALPVLALAACAGEIPTPTTVGLPNPDALILPSPGALPDSQLCVYSAKIEAAKMEWEAYLSRWTEALGREPVNVEALIERLTGENEKVANLLEARRVLCAVEAPEGRP